MAKDKIDPAAFPNATYSGSYLDLIDKPALAPVATTGRYTDLTAKPVLAPVATSGSYADLTNKPATNGLDSITLLLMNNFFNINVSGLASQTGG